MECEEPHSHCKALQLWGAQVSCGGTVLQGTLLYVRPSGLLSRSAPGDHLGKSVLFLSPGHYSSPSIAKAVQGWECSRTASWQKLILYSSNELLLNGACWLSVALANTRDNQRLKRKGLFWLVVLEIPVRAITWGQTWTRSKQQSKSTHFMVGWRKRVLKPESPQASFPSSMRAF